MMEAGQLLPQRQVLESELGSCLQTRSEGCEEGHEEAEHGAGVSPYPVARSTRRARSSLGKAQAVRLTVPKEHYKVVKEEVPGFMGSIGQDPDRTSYVAQLADGAFYYFVDVSRYGSSIELAHRLLGKRKVITIPGEAFGENGAGWLRLSFACTDEGIREGVHRIREELTEV